jgi:hypothetical protein
MPGRIAKEHGFGEHPGCYREISQGHAGAPGFRKVLSKHFPSNAPQSWFGPARDEVAVHFRCMFVGEVTSSGLARRVIAYPGEDIINCDSIGRQREAKNEIEVLPLF